MTDLLKQMAEALRELMDPFSDVKAGTSKQIDKGRSALAKFDAQAATPSPAADAASGSPFEPGPARCAVRWLGRLPQASREYLSGEAFHKDCLDLAMMLEEWIAGHPAPPETPAAPVQQVGERSPSTISLEDGSQLVLDGSHWSFRRSGSHIRFLNRLESQFVRAALSTRPELSDAEIDALRRDAERWQEARQYFRYSEGVLRADLPWIKRTFPETADYADAAIDAALAARGEKR